MKAHLLFKDRDFALGVDYSRRDGFSVAGPNLPPRVEDLLQDLELPTVLRAMARGDALVSEVAKLILLSSLADPEQITYRQEVLFDCIAHPDVAREIYAIAVEAVVGESGIFRPWGDDPGYVLNWAINVLEMLTAQLKRLRKVADEHAAVVTSKGLTTLFAMLQAELDDSYFHSVDDHLERLRFKRGTLISANLGKGYCGVGYALRTPNNTKRGWRERVGMGPRTSYYFQVNSRDDAGLRMLARLNNRGVNLVANALAQSREHVLSFFKLLCAETGFYVACLNLHDQLAAKGEQTCAPVPLPPGVLALSYRGIYDVSLALRSETGVVGNEANADGKSLVMITGANSGGKSTLLRSIGLAQLMMQCGMLVGAEAFRANVAEGIFTHFIREEDKTMRSGKLDEELARMSVIADQALPRSLVLFNESFSATNEREGSEIARQVIEALVDADIKVVFVTHQFSLASTLYTKGLGTALFLRAERGSDGRRTFKVAEGEPLPTSFGEDLYRRMGGWTGAPVAAPGGVSTGPRTDGAHGPGDHL